MSRTRLRLNLMIGGLLSFPPSAFAQTPVIDHATLTQATQTASNTAQIMQTNQQILQYTQRTYNAVTGSRRPQPSRALGWVAAFPCPGPRPVLHCLAAAAFP